MVFRGKIRNELLQNSPFEWQKHSDSSWQCAIDFILQRGCNNLVSDVFWFQHWEESWLNAVEHGRVDVVGHNQRHSDVVMAMCSHFAEQTLMEANASELGRGIICTSVGSKQTCDRTNCDYVTSFLGNHVRKECLGSLETGLSELCLMKRLTFITQ